MRLFLLCLVVSLLCACSGPSTLIVSDETLNGEILANGVVAFKGVPFAEPPVGDLRWQKPQPLQSKQQVRDVTGFAPACMQSMGILEWYRDMAETFGGSRDEFDDLIISEDCLYLNIWTPDAKKDADLPVMVYIHGGSNDSGWAFEPDYHGHELADRNVVVVSIAYRLGVFGFFSHPEIGDADAVANFGLWDQIAALEWIQSNVEEFGGDPNRVTILGESAGAQDILALMAIDQAANLFHGAILQSNAGFGFGEGGSPTLDDEQQRGLKTSALFDFDGPDSLSQLRSVRAGELLDKYEEAFSSYYHAPAIDGQLLTRSVWEAINVGALHDIPFIIGSNGDEWYNSIPEDSDKGDVVNAISTSSHLNSTATYAAIESDSDARRAIDRLVAANDMVCPSQHMARLYDNAWVYYFTRVREGKSGAKVRAYHGAELPYVFGTHASWITTTDIDRNLTEQILYYWTQFAATGNPNTPGLPNWPAFASQNKVMGFSNIAQSTDAPEPVLCRIFQSSMSGEF